MLVSHHDTAPLYTSQIVRQKWDKLLFLVVLHPPYLPYVVPNDFYIFPKLKLCLDETKFKWHGEVIVARDQYFDVSGKFKKRTVYRLFLHH